MSKNRKGKLLVFSVGMLFFIVGFWTILHRIEKTYPMTKKEQEIMAGTETALFEKGDTEKEPVGSITLYGKKYSYFHEIETYLFIGTDGSGNEPAKGETYQGGMADFLLVAVIDKTDHTYGFLQLNRDTITEVTLMQKDGTGMASADIQLCTAHWYGSSREQSCENTVGAVSKLLGNIPITGYYALNMQKIPSLNHAVGGVEVTIDSDFSRIDPEMREGRKMTLNDEQAYHYIHDRYGIGDEENRSRMERQKQYMKAFFKKAKEKIKEESGFVGDLYKELKKDAVTDITGKKGSGIAKEFIDGTEKGIFVPEGTFKVGQALDDGIDHAEFYIQKDSFTSIMTELYNLKKS